MKLIQIKRSCCPPILKNAAADSDKYPRLEVVSELWRMQAGKCCYCERKIPEKGHAKAVEHFAPKSVFKAQRNHWPNLLLACSQCNGKKADQFPVMLTDNPNEVKLIYVKKCSKEVPALIDPSSKKINPEAHLDYRVNLKDGSLSGQIFPRAGSLQGEATISVIGLAQAFYHERRRSHFRKLLVQACLLLQQAKDNDNPAELNIARQSFQDLVSPSSEFAGLAREFAREMELDVGYGLQIPDIH